MFRKSTDRVRVVAASLALLLVGSLGLAACGSGSKGSADGDITVFAAASLTESFTALGKVYEKEHQGSTVTFSFAASSDLAGQVNSGAPADVFASADEPNMKKVTDAGSNAGEPVNFAANVLEIAVPKGNPGKVKGITDLGRTNLTVAACATEVPCGSAARGVFAKAGITGAIDTFEPDVKSVLTKVELGEVDAGLVYHSDVLAAGDKIDSIPIPKADQVVNTYPIVVVKDGKNQKGGQAFIDLVLSKRGKQELKRWGFRSP